jgi:hypothetical protein
MPTTPRSSAAAAVKILYTEPAPRFSGWYGRPNADCPGWLPYGRFAAIATTS